MPNADAVLMIRSFVPEDGPQLCEWRYEPPYDVYNSDHVMTDDPSLATSSSEDHFAIVEAGALIGSCSFRNDARVPGGTYRDGPLDIGIGMRPDLTGRGNGARYLGAVIAFARDRLGARELRATVAEFNARAIRAFERTGFRKVTRFENSDRAYWVL